MISKTPRIVPVLTAGLVGLYLVEFLTQAPPDYYYGGPNLQVACLVFPDAVSFPAGETVRPTARGSVAGDATFDDGENFGITAELILGPAGTDPSTWVFSVAADFSGEAGIADTYDATFPQLPVGTYNYLFRFSFEDEVVLADLDCNTNGITPDQYGVLTVTVATPTQTATPTATPTITPTATTATPSPSPSPSPTTATPTATVEPTGTQPTATATVTPTATQPTPTPGDVDFDFDEGAEGWTFVTVPEFFSEAQGTHIPAGATSTGVLRASVNNNEDDFGFWLSPRITTADFVTTGPIFTKVLGNVGDDDTTPSLVRVNWRMTQSLANTTLTPQFRLRSALAGNEQDHVLVIESNDNGDAIPPQGTFRNYYLHFVLPEAVNGFDLAFDILNFNQFDAESASVDLDSVVISLLDEDILSSGTLEYAADFDAGQNNWTPRTVPDGTVNPLGPFADPDLDYDESGGRLGITNVDVASSNTTVFGWWNSPEAQGQRPFTIEADKLYYGVFRVSTDVAAIDEVPSFRLRMNESGFQGAQYLKVNSTSPAPKGKSPSREYTVFFPPTIGADNYMILAFDLVTNPAFDGDATTGTVFLDSVDVYSLGLDEVGLGSIVPPTATPTVTPTGTGPTPTAGTTATVAPTTTGTVGPTSTVAPTATGTIVPTVTGTVGPTATGITPTATGVNPTGTVEPTATSIFPTQTAEPTATVINPTPTIINPTPTIIDGVDN